MFELRMAVYVSKNGFDKIKSDTEVLGGTEGTEVARYVTQSTG